MAAILAKKLGMTQLLPRRRPRRARHRARGRPLPGHRDPHPRARRLRGRAARVRRAKEKQLTKPELGHLKKAGAAAARATSSSSATRPASCSVGDTVTVEAFEPGQTVKVSGISKGKGFQGTIKRHNFNRGPSRHGSHNVRAPGSIGASRLALRAS